MAENYADEFLKTDICSIFTDTSNAFSPGNLVVWRFLKSEKNGRLAENWSLVKAWMIQKNQEEIILPGNFKKSRVVRLSSL